jgi:hypothetical protein
MRQWLVRLTCRLRGHDCVLLRQAPPSVRTLGEFLKCRRCNKQLGWALHPLIEV